MAIPTNTFTTYDAIGNREDLTDEIYMISPTETPILSAIDREKAKAVNHEWQTDSLAAADDANAVLEGDDAKTDAATATVRLGNICQISDKVVRVTGTQETVDHAGRASEFDHQKMKRGKELRIDIEKILFGTNQAKEAGDATTARTTASALSWIKTNTSKGTGAAADPTAATGAYTRTDGTQRAFSEPLLKAVLSSAWSAGGKPDSIFVNAFNKQAFSTFTGRATPTEDTSKKKIVAAVDAYVSDFGNLKVVPARHVRTRDALVLQTDMWAIAYLRSFVGTPLAKTGDSDRYQILSEYALVSRNEAASGAVYDLTTS